MSSVTNTAKGATNDALDKMSKVGESAQKQSGSSEAGVPRSIPDTSADQSEFDVGQNGSGDGEGEMVPAAGRINEKGEVVDDDGNPIGKVTSGEAKDFAGFVVTQEGDILNEDGGVVGKAEPLEDVASELNYTTKSAKDGAQSPEEGGGLGSVVGGVTGAAQSAVGGAGDAVSKTGKTATDTVGDAAKGTTDTLGEATGTQDATDKVGDATKGATDTAGETAEGAAGTVDDVTKDTTDAAKGVTDDAESAVSGEKTAPDAEGLGDKVNDTADGAKETAEDATSNVKETAEDATGDVQEGAEDGDEAPIELNDAEVPKLGSDAVGDLSDEVPPPQPIGDIEVPSLAPSVANKVVGLFEGPFTVSDGGKVADKDGKILGKLAEGQDIQDLIGKEIHGIDAEGNLLGENDTVLGKVDIAP